MASSSSSMSKIKDLTKEEVLKIENDIKERNFKIQDFKMERIKKKYDFSRYIGKFTKRKISKWNYYQNYLWLMYHIQVQCNCFYF